MKSIRMIGACALSVALSAGAGELELTAENAEVVVAIKCADQTLFAGEEATNFLSRVFGRAIPLVRRPTAGRVSIIVGENEWSRAAGLKPAELPRDGFFVRAEADRLYLCGVDENLPGRIAAAVTNPRWGGSMSRNQRASLFAVYDFLERTAGCRFYYPGELGEIVPRAAALRVPLGTRRELPSVLMRKYYFPDRFDGKPVRWVEGGGESEPGIRKNWLRLRMTTTEIPFCHGVVQTDNLGRFKLTHPEYFALRTDGRRFTEFDGYDASRHGMLCFSSAVTNELYLDAKAYLTGADPATRKCKGNGRGGWEWPCSMRDGKYVDIMPNDSQYKCCCPACRARYDGGKNFFNTIVWGYTRDIAQRLLDEGVGGYVTQMAYSHYSRVPDFELPTNVLVMVAKSGPFAVRNAAQHAEDLAALKAWKKKVGGICSWTYPNEYGSLKLPGVPTVTPRAWARYYRETAPLLYGSFAEAENESFFFNHLNFYVYSRVLWNTSVDTDAVLDEYYRLMYGPAATEVKAYFEALEDTYLDRVVGAYEMTAVGPVARAPGVHDVWTKIYSPAKLAAWDRLLDAAAKRLVPGSLEARRLALLKRETQDVMRSRSDAYLDGTDAARNVAKLKANPPVRDIFAGAAAFRGAAYDRKVRLVGESSVRIVSTNGGATVLRYLDGRDGPILKPNTRYRLSYFVKGENVIPTGKEGGVGTTLMDAFNHWYPEGAGPSGTFDWTHQTFEFTTEPETNVRGSSYLYLRISRANGTAWFDGVRLEELPDQVVTPGKVAIVLDPKAPGPTRFAATELQKFLSRRFSGVEVPIVRTVDPNVFSIILGTNAWSVAAGLEPETLPRDSFVHRTAPGRLYICGCDDPKADLAGEVRGGSLSRHERATLFGVYDFLEKYASCRFYFPGELGEIVPRAKDLPLAALDETVSPEYTVRRTYTGSRAVYFDGAGAKSGPVLNRLRTRMETEIIPCCHGLNAFKYLQRFGKTHPEYFALSQGQRQVDPNYQHAGQLCWSSGVTEEIYRDAKSYLTGDGPEVRGIPPMKGTGFSWNYNCVDRKYVDVMPQDAKMPCDCADCVKACAKRPRLWGGIVPNETDLVWSKVAEWGRRLKAEGVKGCLTMMSYPPYEDVPDFDLPDNIQVMLAVTGPFAKNDREKTAKDDARIRAWVKKLGHKVWLWTYPNKYGNTDIEGVPQFSMHAWGEFYQQRRNDIFGAFAESESDRWFYNHLNYYVFGRVMWNTRDSVDRILAEYNTFMFGRTATAWYMGQLVSSLEKKWTDGICGNVVTTSLGPQIVPPNDGDIWTRVYPPDYIAQLDRWLEAAEKAVAPGEEAPLVRRRIALYRDEIVAPMKAASGAFLSLRRQVLAQPHLKPREEVPLVPYRVKDVPADTPAATASAWVEGGRLHARYRCSEPRMDAILAVKRVRDDHFLWQDNNVEFFFCPTGDRSLVYQIIVNSEGCTVDTRKKLVGKTADVKRDWNPDLKVRVRREPRAWTCEFSVPLDSIEPLAKEIPLCFGRSRVLKSGKVPVPYFTSSPLSPNWSDPTAYPVLDSDHR